MESTVEIALHKIKEQCSGKSPFLVAIDGRCAAGKTTLAALLQKELDCSVVHMDHFFLRPEQRTDKRLQQPGGNVDYERFEQEVMLPLKKGIDFTYRPYDCQRQELSEPMQIVYKPVCLVEGSYSCHPQLFEYYDFRIFMNVNPKEQLRRIELRNGKEGLMAFKEKWIPLEENYFFCYDIRGGCHLVLET